VAGTLVFSFKSGRALLTLKRDSGKVALGRCGFMIYMAWILASHSCEIPVLITLVLITDNEYLPSMTV